MGNLEVNDFVLQPFSKTRNTFGQFAAGFEARVGDSEDIDSRERMADERAQMLRKLSECVIATFETMYEDEE